MLVMAVGALHQLFVHPVPEGFVELRFDFQVAGIAELGLALHEQELTLLGMVRRVAIGAAHVVDPVHRAGEIAVFFAVLVTVQAALADLLGSRLLEDEDLGLVAATIHVVGAGPVAGLAAHRLGAGAFPERRLPVWGLLKILVDILVAGLASLCTSVSRHLGIRLRSFFPLGACRDGKRESQNPQETK